VGGAKDTVGRPWPCNNTCGSFSSEEGRGDQTISAASTTGIGTSADALRVRVCAGSSGARVIGVVLERRDPAVGRRHVRGGAERVAFLGGVFSDEDGERSSVRGRGGEGHLGVAL
jgi:hypothetical protein